MKRISMILLILSSGLSVLSQTPTLWLPFGSSDIGDSPNYNVGIGINTPESNLHLKGDGLSFWISRSTYLSIGSDIGMDFRQLTDNGVFRTGGAIKSISTDSYTGGVGSTYDSDLVLYSAGDGELVEGIRLNALGNIGIGMDNPETKLHIKGDGLSLRLSPSTYKSVGSEIGMDFRQLTNNGVFRTGGAIKSISTDAYTGGVGSTYDSDLVLFSAEDGELVEGLRINSAGKVAIGTIDFSGNHLFRVDGSIGAREIKVEANGWSDFVFENNYLLPTLEEVEQHISENGHLPEIPNEAEVSENGINLGEMNAKLLQKIEELTLYLIEQNKQIQNANQNIAELRKEVSALKKE